VGWLISEVTGVKFGTQSDGASAAGLCALGRQSGEGEGGGTTSEIYVEWSAL